MQEVLLFTEPSKRQVWENTFNSNDFHVYAFHPLKDLINSDTAVNLIKDDKVDIAFIDITSLAKRKAENREVYLKSIQTISQEIAPDDKFSRLAFYLPENLPADIAQLVQTAFAFKVYDFFQPKNGQFRADTINTQLHRPKSIENGTKFFTLANQAVQAQSKEIPAASDNVFSSDSDDIDDDEMMGAVYEAVTGKKYHADEPAKAAKILKSKDIPEFAEDDFSKPKDGGQNWNDADTQQEEPVESETGDEPLGDEKQHEQLHRIQPYEKQFDVEPKPKHNKHFLGRKKKRPTTEENPKEIEKPSSKESQKQPDFTDDFLYDDYGSDYGEPEEEKPEPSKLVAKKKPKKVKASKQRPKTKKKSKKTLILLVALAVIIIVGVGFVGTHGLDHLNFNTSTTSAPAKGSLDSLLDAGDFTKAVEDYPSKQSQIDNYILNDDNISNKGNVINQVYTNAESPNDTVVFDNAYFQKDWDTVIANKNGADLTMQRKAMLCIAYLGKGDVSEAQVYAKKVNNHELNQKVAKYKELQSTNQQIENKLKDNNLSQNDRQQLQKQLNNDKSAMKTLINN